jgi:hypothetical protein
MPPADAQGPMAYCQPEENLLNCRSEIIIPTVATYPNARRRFVTTVWGLSGNFQRSVL